MKVAGLLLLVVLAPFALAAERPLSPTRVEVSRDLWISSYEKEREGNNGASPKLKLKGIQEFFLIDFDPVPWRGKHVVRAELHVHPEGAESLGRTTVSSIAEEWVEGSGTGYARVSGASSFDWARTDEQRWRDVDITGAINGAGGSVWGFGDPPPRDEGGWQIIPIAPEVVQARLDGASYGFCVMDDVGNEYTRHGETIEYRQFPNRFVASREGSRKTAPYFVLWLDDSAPLLKPHHPLPAMKSPGAAKRPGCRRHLRVRRMRPRSRRMTNSANRWRRWIFPRRAMRRSRFIWKPRRRAALCRMRGDCKSRSSRCKKWRATSTRSCLWDGRPHRRRRTRVLMWRSWCRVMQARGRTK